MAFEEGELILVDYVGKVDGEVFDTSVEEKAEEAGLQREDADYDPIPVLIGERYVIEGLEEAVRDMEVGEERELEVPKEKAYGKRESENVETYPEREFEKQNVSVRPGEQVMIGNRQGRVMSVNSGRVRIDFNHPLAGKNLEYWVKIVEKIEDEKEKAEYIYSYRVGHGEIEFEDDTIKVPATHSHGDHEHELPKNVREELRDELLDYTDFEEVEFVEE